MVEALSAPDRHAGRLTVGAETYRSLPATQLSTMA
jgi:hypothetical protein